ncbi:MAG: Xaa-Pro peptidase family protein [Armatimonadota bacterium]
MHKKRIYKIIEIINSNGCDSFLVTSIDNIFYLSGFTGSTAALIITENDTYILVDPRYSIQARNECNDIEVVDYTGKSTIDAVSSFINDKNIKSVLCEADNLSVTLFNKLKSSLNESISLELSSGVVEKLRMVKDEYEIEKIKSACRIVDDTISKISNTIKVGMTEKEVAILIDYTMRSVGADKAGFDTIAASGHNSACPHASPTDRKLQYGDFLKLDFGAELNRYNSDITRTFVIGKPTDKHKEIYNTVLAAQMKAIEAIKPNISGKEIDDVARNYIAECGYGKNFGHGLGHSIGIEVHDGPGLSQTSDIILQPGMVFTVEPGIYIEGFGGVRIEDDVLVTETGYEILTHSNKKDIVVID